VLAVGLDSHSTDEAGHDELRDDDREPPYLLATTRAGTRLLGIGAVWFQPEDADLTVAAVLQATGRPGLLPALEVALDGRMQEVTVDEDRLIPVRFSESLFDLRAVRSEPEVVQIGAGPTITDFLGALPQLPDAREAYLNSIG